jgi:type II secretory pathway component PulM
MAFNPQEVFNFYQRLSPRERLLLGLALGSVMVISFYTFLWEPLLTGREVLQRRIAVRERELVEMQSLRTRYLELLRQVEASQAVLVKTEANFSLFAHLQSAVAQEISREHIQSMNPTDKNLSEEYQEQSVEIKLTAVNIGQLVNMMYRIEKGEPRLRVSRMQVKKRYNDPRSFDIVATVSLLKPRAAASPAVAPAGGAS